MKTLQNLVMLSVVSAFSLSANADGNSKDPQYPRLAGQHANYLERALSEYQGGGRKNPIMSGFAAGLSKQDVKDVAAWFASQDGLTSPIEPRTVQR